MKIQRIPRLPRALGAAAGPNNTATGVVIPANSEFNLTGLRGELGNYANTFQGVVETLTAEDFDGDPANVSRADFYELIPGNSAGGTLNTPGRHLGHFEFKPDGSLTFNTVAAPPAVAVPAFVFEGGKAVESSSDPAQIYKGHVEYALRSKWERPPGLADRQFVAEVEVAFAHPRAFRRAGSPRSHHAMSLKRTTKRGHGTLNELNITPLLDLVFVLLVIFLDDQPVTASGLQGALQRLKAAEPEMGVVVKGADDADYQHMVNVLDVLQRLNITKVGLATGGGF